MEWSGTIWTDSGMCALWDPASFPGIVDYDSWDAALGEDDRIARHIEAGAFVPVNIRSDGAFGALVRVGELAGLTDRETRYLFLASEPYLFVSSGEAWISGIERVGDPSDYDGFGVKVPAGRWAATVHVLDWNEEPGSVGPDRRPTADALPDFVVVLAPDSGGPYRTTLVTFDRTNAPTPDEPHSTD
jgi:hypothetical protein